MFYNGLEVEQITISYRSHSRVDGVLLCHNIYSRGSRTFFRVSTFFYNVKDTIYTIHFKNGTSREDIKKEYTLSEYGENTSDEQIIIGGTDQLPYKRYDDYPKTKESGGCAPGSIVVKNSTINERRIFSFQDLPTAADDMAGFPKGTLYIRNDMLCVL